MIPVGDREKVTSYDHTTIVIFIGGIMFWYGVVNESTREGYIVKNG